MFVTADQLALHVLGDYVLQSDWMASEKVKRSIAALAHVVLYTLPFLSLTQSPIALAVILGSHFIIDRWRLARYVVWAKNFLAPKWIRVGEGEATRLVRNLPWEECKGNGYDPQRPAWLTTWLMIAADNLMHVLCNAAALRWL
jgi:hypothetical protein